MDNKEKVSGWGFNFSLPDWLSKWPKRKDASPMQQGSQMAEEGKTESPSGLSGKGVGDGERSVPGTSETRRARPKGRFCFLLFSINPFVLKFGFLGLFTDCYIFCCNMHYGNLVLSV